MNKDLILNAVSKGYSVDENGNVYNSKGVKRKLNINNRGYYYFSVRTEKGARSVLVHRLRAYFIYGNDLFNPGFEIRHLDNNKLNNLDSNLSLGTHTENMNDIEKTQRRINASTIKYNHKEIIRDKKSGMSHSKLMKKYNINSKGTISYIVNKSLTKEGILK